MPPKEAWFFETIGPEGQPLVYLRFQATGMVARRIGPFASCEIAVWMLDMILDLVTDGLIEVCNNGSDHTVSIPLQRRAEIVTPEDYFTFSPSPKPSKPKPKSVPKAKATKKATAKPKPSKRKAA